MAPAHEEGLRIKLDRLDYWKSVGAQLSPTVTRLTRQYRRNLAAANTVAA